MYWRKLFYLVFMGLLVIGFSLPALACVETKGFEIKVQAPLEATNCGATPPTISVLGLTIDISMANLYGDDDGTLTCADLKVGQAVEVTLASGNPVPATGFLLATEVELEKDGCHDYNVGQVKIAAPLQAIDTTDPNVPKVKVLGLTIDISNAILKGDDNYEPINVSQLMAGQFAKLTLVSNTPPLSANTLWVHQVEIKVQAPLESINCGGTPPTISMLGLTIDISKASLYREDGGTLTCADLKVGQVVEVTLASDIPGTNGLVATKVEIEEGDCHDNNVGYVKIVAPLQAIDTTDPNVPKVKVLGLLIDVSKAILKGNEDDEPISLNQWMIGQFAMLTLASSTPPLSANTLWVHQVEIKVQAPLDEVNCTATPPTIKVLGLTIDISKASLYKEDDCYYLTCTNLKVGQVVKVTLASDIPDPTTNLLSATEAKMGKGDCYDDNVSDVKIVAPLQVIDRTNRKVTILGLVIDISKAILELNNGLPITIDQLSVGQFAKLMLTSNQSPLSAILLVAQKSAVQATVQVIDEKGNPVNDGAVNDIQADVTVGQGRRAQIFHFTGNGSFYLSGLPAGRAKIVVTRIRNGQKSTGSGSFKVEANKTQYILIRLRPTRR